MTLSIFNHAVAEAVYLKLKENYSNANFYKVLLSGLTPEFSKQLHARLLNEGLNSYLVVDRGNPVSKENNIISEGALVNIRNQEDKWIMIVPNYLVATLLESITNAAKSQVFFNSNWPWNDDDKLISFWSEKGVFDTLLDIWGVDESDWQERFRQIIDLAIFKSLKNINLNDRSLLVVDDLLGGFTTNETSNKKIFEDFLVHLGIPVSDDLLDIDSEFNYKLGNRTANLVKNIIKRLNNDLSSRDDILLKLSDEPFCFSGDVLEKYSSLINIFFDGIFERNSISGNNILGLREGIRKCLLNNNVSDIATWLTHDNLSNLFDVKDINSKVDFDVEFIPEQNQILSENNIKLLSHIESVINVKFCNFKIKNYEAGSVWKVSVYNRTQELASKTVSDSDKEVELSFDAEIITSYKNQKRLSCKVECDGEVINKQILVLELCGEDRPVVICIGDELNTIKIGSDDTEMVVNESSYFYMVTNLYEDIEVDLNVDGECLPWVKDNNVNKSSSPINPRNKPLNRLETVIQIPSLPETYITFISQYARNGELTIDLELEAVAKNGNKKNLEKLLDRFTGENVEFYPKLGGIEGPVIWRDKIAKLFENGGDESHYPVISKLGELNSHPIKIKGVYANCYSRGKTIELFRGEPNNELLNAIDKYASIRNSLIKLVDSNSTNVPHESDHPVYARTPTYCEINESEISNTIAIYLDSYIEILNFVESSAGLNIVDIQVGLNLDTIYLLSDESSGLPEGVRILGPWHPVSVLNRFWLQKSMVNYLKEYLIQGQSHSYHRGTFLIQLLRENALLARWETYRNGQFVPSSLSTCKDSGWLVSVDDKITSFISKEKDIGNATRVFFLETGLNLIEDIGHFEDVATRIISDYTNTYPADRRIELDFSSGYTINQAVRVITGFISNFNSEDKGDLFSYLPGGIHAKVDIDDESVDCPELDELVETGVPTYFYKRKVNQFKSDIHFRPITQNLSFEPETKNKLLVHRGYDEAALIAIRERGIRIDHENSGTIGVIDSLNISETNLSESLVRLNNQILSFDNNKNYVLQCTPTLIKSIDSPWIFLPSKNVDPALVKHYLSDVNSQPRALWEYKVDIERGNSSYYLLSKTDEVVRRAISNFLPNNSSDPDSIIREMNQLGVALSAEAQRTNNKARGCVGVVGASRVIDLDMIEDLLGKDNTISTLIPIDSFESFFSKSIHTENTNDLLTDLMVIIFHLPDDNDTPLYISAVGIESKYASNMRTEKFNRNALEQAETSFRNFKSLVEDSISPNALPLRSALIKLCRFALRIRCDFYDDDFRRKESLIYKHLTQGTFGWVKYESIRGLVVVSASYNGASTKIESLGARGMYVELDTRKDTLDWPMLKKEHDSKAVILVRESLSKYIAKTPLLNEVTKTDETGVNVSKPSDSFVEEDRDVVGEDMLTPVNPTQDIVDMDDKNNNFRVKLGRNPITLDDIYWDPYLDSQSLDNYGIAVTGSSGSGKTQLVKLIASQAAKMNLPVMLVDYKNDFIDDEFISSGNFEVVDINSTGLPFNPFELNSDNSGHIKPISHIYTILDLFKSAFGNDLSHAMVNALKKAMIEAYDVVGINARNTYQYSDLENILWPDFNRVWDILFASDTSRVTLDALESRLGVIKDMSYLPSSSDNVAGFNSLADKKIVLSMMNVQSNQLKELLSEILIMRYHNYILTAEGKHKFERFLVFDEAWRISESKKLAELVRESRAFGLGVLLSSQIPQDFSSILLGNMETKIFLNAELPETKNEIAKILAQSQNAQDKKQLINEMESIGKFQGYIKNKQNKPYKRIDTIPFTKKAWNVLPTGHAYIKHEK